MDAANRNARFWAYVNGSNVKLTLSPGRSLAWYQSYPHDEGWSSVYERWTHEGDRITREIATDGRDCDGRFSTFTAGHCPIDKLAEIEEISGENYPAWQRDESSQRDYTAESMGY